MSSDGGLKYRIIDSVEFSFYNLTPYMTFKNK